MIKIYKSPETLILSYTPDGDPEDVWIETKLSKEGVIQIKKIFLFKKEDLISEEGGQTNFDGTRKFILGVKEGEYYRIKDRILGLNFPLLLYENLKINLKTFIAETDISVFSKIDELVREQIIIGGDRETSMAVSDFEELLSNFPTKTELKHYARARVGQTLKDYFVTMSDPQMKLEKFLNRKKTIPAPSRIKFIQEYEKGKFEFIRDEMKNMLNDAESYKEKDWQKLVASFLLLIFPKYVKILEEVRIKDFYASSTPTDRYIDLTLVDSDGSMDILEVKRPFASSLLASREYRDNYIPRDVLSGTIMQVEKYIFHLSKWGKVGEEAITQKYQSEFPANFKINITNPKGIILLGRDEEFDLRQKFDFEIIRRKYANIIDIMTYDDLLRRLENIIAMTDSKFNSTSDGNL